MGSYLAIYLIGFIVTYWSCKIIRGKDNNEWHDVFITIGFSIFSWIGATVILGMSIFFMFKNSNGKPPKFL